MIEAAPEIPALVMVIALLWVLVVTALLWLLSKINKL